jgi:hypothetical protein
MEHFFKMMRDRRFAGGRKTGKPDNRTFVAVEFFTIFTGHKAIVPGDVVVIWGSVCFHRTSDSVRVEL